MNYSEWYTDKEIIKLSKKLKKVYADIYREIEKEARDYFEKFRPLYEKELAEFQEGKKPTFYTEATFRNWVIQTIGRGKRWEQLRYNIAKRITNTNVIASDYINNKMLDVFLLNYNFQSYEVYRASGISFNIYNEYTIKELTTKQGKLFPKAKINISKDIQWNETKLDRALLSGVMQGKSIDKIAASFQQVTDMNRNSALRNARTRMNSVQNLGRQQQMHDLKRSSKSTGLKLQKEWISAHDNRVRDSHAHLDGVRVDIDDYFPNGLLYPADMEHGTPQEYFNCRCSHGLVVDGITTARTNYSVETYKQWVKDKEKEQRDNEKQRSNVRN